MYKYLGFFIFIMMLFSPVFAWDYFCSVNEDAVKISINPSVGISCDDYIANLDLLLVNTANELVNLNVLIKQWKDVEYWKSVRDQKQIEMRSFSTLKNRILSHIDKFSYAFFVKIRDYVILSIKSDIENYITVFKKIQWFQENYPWYLLSENLDKYQEILVDVLTIVQDIYDSENIDEILKHYRKYIYLKDILEWKFE